MRPGGGVSGWNPPVWWRPLNLASDLHLGPEQTLSIWGDNVFLNGRPIRLNGFRIFCDGPIDLLPRPCGLPCKGSCPLCARGQWTIISARDGLPVTMHSNEISGEIGVPDGCKTVPGETCVCCNEEAVLIDIDGFLWCGLSGHRVYGKVTP